MTTKQRQARAKFKAAIKEAGKLRKKNPGLTQAEAVKQAWAILYSKERKGEKIGYSKEREKLHKNATAWLKKRKKIDAEKSKKDRVSLAYQQAPFGKPGSVGAVKKKSATKVKAKKGKSTEMHTDTKSHNVNIRVVSGIKVKSKELRKQLEKKGYRLTHGYTVAKRKSIGDLPTYRDKDAAREIELFADNDSQLYYQYRRPILINLSKKYKKGTFDVDKAAKLWRYFIDAALKKYNKEFGSRGDKWYDLLDTNDRNLLATEYAMRTKQEFDLGNLPE